METLVVFTLLLLIAAVSASRTSGSSQPSAPYVLLSPGPQPAPKQSIAWEVFLLILMATLYLLGTASPP